MLWPALILAPLLALADQSAAYALAPWLCGHQQTAMGHAVHVLFLVAIVITGVPAWAAARVLAPAEKTSSEGRPMLAVVAALVALLSIVIVVALWIPQWVLSPCFS